MKAVRWLIATVAVLALTACGQTATATPRSTAQAIIHITPAPTLQIDATATAYAQQLIPTPTPAGLYTVQRGDTLGGIAAQFGTTVAELIAANGLTDPNAIQAGQSLLIPSIRAGTPVRGTLPTIVAATPLPTLGTP